MTEYNSKGAPAHNCPDLAAGTWSPQDVLDFEHLAAPTDKLHRPGQVEETLPEARRFFIDCVEPVLGRAGLHPQKHANQYKRRAVRHWLEYQRVRMPAGLRPLLPGQLMARSMRLATMLLVVVGFFAGGTVAAGLLQSGHAQTVNVTWFLIVLVGLQLVAVLVTVAVWMFRRTQFARDLNDDLSTVGLLMTPLLEWIAKQVRKARMDALPDDLREGIADGQGSARAELKLHGPVYMLSVIMLAQWFGVAFNVGAVTTTALRTAGTDLAFGWETSHDRLVDEQFATDAVKLASLPWRWYWGAGVGYPSREQIGITRTYESDKVAEEERLAHHSWSLFLILAVVFYGLLPRLVLLVVVKTAIRRHLETIPLRGEDIVFGRMQEQVSIESPDYSGEHQGGTPTGYPLPSQPDFTYARAGEAPSIPQGMCLLLVHIDLRFFKKAEPLAKIEPELRLATGWRVQRVVVFGRSTEQDEQAMCMVRSADWHGSPPRIAVFVKGNDAPVTQHERFLRTLRARAGDHASIRICVLSRSKRNLPIRARYLNLWEQMVKRMADPLMQTIDLTDVGEPSP